MSQHKYDVWLLTENTVYKGVPYEVVTDWVTQAKLGPEDRLKPSGTEQWETVANTPLFEPYLPRPEPQRVEDVSEAMEPVELDFHPKRHREDEDDDVDMIPLIDISLVLLIFFMMTTTVAAISRVSVPDMSNAAKIDPAGDTLCIYLDKTATDAIDYGVGKGTTAPAGANASLNEEGLLGRLDLLIAESTKAVKIRIAAHRDLSFEQVERIMKELDRRKKAGVAIAEYTVEVGERIGP